MPNHVNTSPSGRSCLLNLNLFHFPNNWLYIHFILILFQFNINSRNESLRSKKKKFEIKLKKYVIPLLLVIFLFIHRYTQEGTSCTPIRLQKFWS
jgi:hypothetical protein